MSNLAKQSIKIPANITVKINNNVCLIEGPLGKKPLTLLTKVILNESKNEITVSDELFSDLINNKNLNAKALQGNTCALIKQTILGLSTGFRKQLNIIGVGYRASIEDTSKDILNLKLGYSHPIYIKIPKNLKINCLKPTKISIFGSDKQEVNQMASAIRSYKLPEPYKGKGILYQNEKIIKKEGKRS